MAFVTTDTAELILTFKDETGSTSTLNIPVSNTYAPSAAEVNALVDLLEAFTLGQINSVRLTKRFYDGSATIAQQDSRVERKGVLTLADDQGRTVTLQVPTIEDSIMNDSGAIFVNDDEVEPFINWLRDNARTTANTPLTKVTSAYERFNSSTKGRLPRNKLVFSSAILPTP